MPSYRLDDVQRLTSDSSAGTGRDAVSPQGPWTLRTGTPRVGYMWSVEHVELKASGGPPDAWAMFGTIDPTWARRKVSVGAQVLLDDKYSVYNLTFQQATALAEALLTQRATIPFPLFPGHVVEWYIDVPVRPGGYVEFEMRTVGTIIPIGGQ